MNVSYTDLIKDNMIQISLHSKEISQKIHPDLLGHLLRVELYVYLLCCEMAANGFREIQENNCSTWSEAAFFHDIGKIRIPQTILMKPGKLSAAEMAMVREHSVYAKDVLAEFLTPQLSNDPEFFSLTIFAALFHHEWWNGKGYPFRIAGEAIPLIARVTSICDAFDAITYGRPYCGARSADAAFSEIEACAGSQFDPNLSAFFIEHKDVFLRSCRGLAVGVV